MEKRDLDYFRQLLETELNLLFEKAGKTVWELLVAPSDNESDLLDRATQELSQNNVFRIRSRESRLIKKIRESLQAIEDGTYGYCEETGEPISLRRLEARPIATLSVEAQERHERRERIYRDD